MRRADRLFQIIQILRSARRPVTAQRLADELRTSTRTIYRDITDLSVQQVPIRGEAGIGYVLERGYDMPPLMLTADEIEAAVLGAQWVAARGDAALARGARDLIAKIDAVLPRRLRHIVLESTVIAAISQPAVADALDMSRVRAWIRERRKLRLQYEDEHGRVSTRTVWPIAAAYFDAVRLIAGWCELRRGFRHFRTDRIKQAEFLNERIPRSAQQLLEEWRASERASNRGRTRGLNDRMDGHTI
jgi:predicted DNA-binding transcriptional regulator YafY